VLLAHEVHLEAETPSGFTAFQLASDPEIRRLLPPETPE
jgi:hypothetical protein